MNAIEAFEHYCDAWARHDHIAMADLFTDDGVFDASSLDAPVKGRSALLRELRIVSSAMTDIKTETRIAIETQTGAVVEGTYHAKIIGTGGKVDGSPGRVDFRYVGVVEMRDGKIAVLREIFDTRGLHAEERQRVWAMNRRTPYWQGTVDAKCMEWSVYNNMYFPMIYSRTPYEDYAALVEGVTLWDVALERQTQICGPDALAFLDYLCCRDMSTMNTGDCRYTLLTDEKEEVLVDPVVLRPWDDVVWLSHGNTDITLWARGIAMNSSWEVEVSEPDVAPLQVQGPLALEVMEPLCEAPLEEMKKYKCVVTEVAGQPAVVSRTGWSGGFGYEIYPLSSDRAMALWNAILIAGKPFGLKVTGPVVHRALERGVTDSGYYNNSGMNALEEVACNFVHLDKKADFIGKTALRRIRAQGVKRHSVGLLIDAEAPRLEWFWKLMGENGAKGEVRWATHSFALDRSIGIAVVDKSIRAGDFVEIEHPYGVCKAEVTNLPFAEPGN